MKIFKPKFWDKEIGIISILLLPITFIYIFLSNFKKILTKTNLFQIPIICVGNIYIGGTGKTPTSIFIANEFNKVGKKTAIIRKYYKGHDDEYCLIKKYFNNLIISKSRAIGLKEAEKYNYDLAVLDDGFQDHSVKKNVKIICFNNDQLIGNGLVLPSGPLRENLNTLKKTDLVIINGDKNEKFESKILNINPNLEIFYSFYAPIDIDQFKNNNLLAIAGIGNPENFFHLLEKNNLKVSKKLVFPDHYIFSRSEIQSIINEAERNKLQIIMTEKDYYKIEKYKLEKIKYLKVNFQIKNKEKFINKLNELYAKNI